MISWIRRKSSSTARRINELVRSGRSELVIISQLQSMGLAEDLVKCISEMLTACSLHR